MMTCLYLVSEWGLNYNLQDRSVPLKRRVFVKSDIQYTARQ
jgi:hypothetical protein